MANAIVDRVARYNYGSPFRAFNGGDLWDYDSDSDLDEDPLSSGSGAGKPRGSRGGRASDRLRFRGCIQAQPRVRWNTEHVPAPVTLHIYDIGKHQGMGAVNKLLRQLGTGDGLWATYSVFLSPEF